MAKREPVENDYGEYTDYLLLSSSDFTQGWKHNIMRLAPASSSEVVEPQSWTGGAKMNRRDQRRLRREEEEAARKAAQQAAEEAARARGEEIPKLEEQELQPGMPGYYAQKRAREAKERAERDESLVAPGAGGAAASSSASSTVNRPPRRGFGAPKKTRRVFITEESSKERRIKFEEQHPWYLETTEEERDIKPAQAGPSSAPSASSSGGNTRWIGKMDSSASGASVGGEGSQYMLLVLDQDARSNQTAFKVVPANRWYRFTPRPKYHTMTGDEAEKAYTEMQKSGDMDTWFASRRMPTATSSTSAGIQAGRTNRDPDSFMSNGTAQSGGNSYMARFAQARGEQASSSSSRFRTVIGDQSANDESMWGEAQEAGPAGRRAGKTRVQPRRRQGGDDDQYEEMEFEAEFQDDEEGIGAVGDEAIEEEDTKELEERIKREMRGANHGLGDAVDEGEEEDEISKNLTKAGQRVKRLLKRRGRKGRPEDEEDDLDEDDDDDDTRNPYASEEEETDSETEREREKEKAEKAKTAAAAAEANKKATQQLLQQQQAGRTGPNLPGAQQGPASQNKQPPLSRNGSVGPTSAALGKKPSNSSNLSSRAPSAGPGSRATSPSAIGTSNASKDSNNLLRRATSPVNTQSGTGSRANSPTPPPSATKRKAEHAAEGVRSPTGAGAGNGEVSSKKRRKPGSPSPAPISVAPGDDSALIAKDQIIGFIREKKPSTKELLKHFKSSMARDPRNKDVILQTVKEVASINDGKLNIKPEFA